MRFLLTLFPLCLVLQRIRVLKVCGHWGPFIVETADYSGWTDQAYELECLGAMTGAKRHDPEPQVPQWWEAYLAVVLQVLPMVFRVSTAEPF